MKWLLAVLLLLVGTVLAVDVVVDSSSGPLGLEDALREAFATWQTLDEDVEVDFVAEADNRFSYGEAERFPAELASLTVTRLEGRTRQLELLFNPDDERLIDRASLHEAGIVLGLSPSDSGIMASGFSREDPVELMESDREAFLALNLFAAEDLNQDGAVDFYDLIELAKVFGRSVLNTRADLNEDGVVDDADLLLLQAAYTFSEPSAQAPQDQAAQRGSLPSAPNLSNEVPEIPEGLIPPRGGVTPPEPAVLPDESTDETASEEEAEENIPDETGEGDGESQGDGEQQDDNSEDESSP